MASLDYRSHAFDATRVDRTARAIGRGPFAQLYAAENALRVVVNSVLVVQSGPDWWLTSVDPRLQAQATTFATRHAAKPWYSTPGPHGLYYLFLSDLAEIVRANLNLFLPLVPDINLWLFKIEDVRLPRNVVCHMNFPTTVDQQRIAVFYNDVRRLVSQLASEGLAMKVP
jgi:hypothetical protein